MLRFPHVTAAIALVVCLGTTQQTTLAAAAPLTLLEQAEGLPKEFQDHFFDVPLAVRVVLDGQVLGEAMVVLSRDERITLLDFTDTRDSPLSAGVRDTWQALLEKGIALGVCTQQCANQLVAAHYNLGTSELSLLTSQAEHSSAARTHHQLPEHGSSGLMLRSQLNLAGGEQQDLYGRYALQGISSLGDWTQTFSAQLARNDNPEQKNQYSVYELHTQKEWNEHFLRVGYFTPDSVGLSRQPRSFGDSPDTALGLMVGSSDSLAIDGAKPSMYPIYVTANRDGMVEIYRNGALINSQSVQAGLQALDTRPLPGGIYDIEVRLLEDGIVTSRTDVLVYKPRNWSNPAQPWRYNAFVGRESSLLSNVGFRDDEHLNVGAAINYLLHPRAVVGLSARNINAQNQFGTSLDLGLGASSSLYASVYQAQNRGVGSDIQALHNYGSGNVVVSHSRSWLDNRTTWETLRDGTRVRQRNRYNGQVSSSSLAVNHRLSAADSLNARVSHSQGQTQGVGIDLGWLRSSKLFGHEANWRLSVFDRPASGGTADTRNRGVDVSLNLAIGSPGKHFTANVGSRTARNGESERNLSLGYQQDIQQGPLRSVSGNVQADSYGVGLSGAAQFETDHTSGDVLVQRSSYNRQLSGGLNLNSNLVVGGGQVAISSRYLHNDAGMIVDVDSDIEGIELRFDDLSGSSAVLKPGRNVVPVTAYKSGQVQFDFKGTDAPAASISPQRAAYHLNKGGVAYQQVRVLKTVTVFGRLVDHDGQALKGLHVLNHASRGVTEADGFFSMELSVRAPTLDVVRGQSVICRVALDPHTLPSEGDVVMAGDLRCIESSEPEPLVRS